MPQAGTARWKCAAVMCVSLHTLPNIPSRPCRTCREPPLSSLTSEGGGILDFRELHVTRLSQGCVQTRASALRLRRHHTTVEVLCASGGGPGYLGELPLIRSTSMYATRSKEKVVVDRLDRVWLQTYVQSDPQAQNFFVVTL